MINSELPNTVDLPSLPCSLVTWQFSLYPSSSGQFSSRVTHSKEQWSCLISMSQSCFYDFIISIIGQFVKVVDSGTPYSPKFYRHIFAISSPYAPDLGSKPQPNPQ
jgi:hypothetical protein